MTHLQFEKLHLFTVAGGTFKFLNGEILQFNDKVLVFAYRSESDGDIKQGNFWTSKLFGYSVVEKKS